MSRGLIIIDAGHGKEGNPYPIMPGKFEGTQNYYLALHLDRELRARGFDTMLTRPELDDDPSLVDRGRMAGDNGAILFISLHSNAPGPATLPEQYDSVRGSETYYSVSDEARNATLALALNDAVVHTMNTDDRGIKTRRSNEDPSIDFYSVLRNSVASGCKCAVLVEHGFHTNRADAAFLTDDACLSRLAAAEAEAIDKFFS